MQFLITVDDLEHGLGSGTERSLTEQITDLCTIWDRMPGIGVRLEVHEQVVYGAERERWADGTCENCGHAPHKDGFQWTMIGECEYCPACPRPSTGPGATEPCDECSGTRWPVERHDESCSLDPANSVG